MDYDISDNYPQVVSERNVLLSFVIVYRSFLYRLFKNLILIPTGEGKRKGHDHALFFLDVALQHQVMIMYS